MYHRGMSPKTVKSKSRAALSLRAARYSRVSRLHDGQAADESESIESQDDECQEACDTRAWPVVREYTDPGFSASEFAKIKVRPDWDKLLDEIPRNVFDVIVMWESSRGDRKPPEWIGFLYLCRDHDVKIHILSHDIDALGITYDMRRPQDLDKLSREGLDNAKSSVETSQRQRRLKRSRRAKGLPDGSIPYAMQRRYNPETGKILDQSVDDTTAPVVREIFERIAAYHKVVAIRMDLERRGIANPSGGTKWHASTVRRIASNWAYIAKIRDGERIYDAQWPALVDEAVFHKVQSILATRSTEYNEATGKIRRARPGRAVHELSCIAQCAECGETLGTNPARGRGAYFCVRGHNSISMPWLDTYVAAMVVQCYSVPGRYSQIVANDDAAVVAAQTDISRIETELADLYAQATRGELSAMMAGSLEQGLLTQLAAAEARRDEAAVPPVLRDLLNGPVEEMAERYVALGVAGRRAVVRMTLRVVVASAHGDRRGSPEVWKQRVRFTGPSGEVLFGELAPLPPGGAVALLVGAVDIHSR